MPDESELVNLINTKHRELFDLKVKVTIGVITKEDLDVRIKRLRRDAEPYLSKIVEYGNSLQDEANKSKAAAILSYWNDDLYQGQSTWHLEASPAKADK